MKKNFKKHSIKFIISLLTTITSSIAILHLNNATATNLNRNTQISLNNSTSTNTLIPNLNTNPNNPLNVYHYLRHQFSQPYLQIIQSNPNTQPNVTTSNSNLNNATATNLNQNTQISPNNSTSTNTLIPNPNNPLNVYLPCAPYLVPYLFYNPYTSDPINSTMQPFFSPNVNKSNSNLNKTNSANLNQNTQISTNNDISNNTLNPSTKTNQNSINFCSTYAKFLIYAMISPFDMPFFYNYNPCLFNKNNSYNIPTTVNSKQNLNANTYYAPNSGLNVQSNKNNDININIKIKIEEDNYDKNNTLSKTYKKNNTFLNKNHKQPNKKISKLESTFEPLKTFINETITNLFNIDEIRTNKYDYKTPFEYSFFTTRDFIKPNGSFEALRYQINNMDLSQNTKNMNVLDFFLKSELRILILDTIKNNKYFKKIQNNLKQNLNLNKVHYNPLAMKELIAINATIILKKAKEQKKTNNNCPARKDTNPWLIRHLVTYLLLKPVQTNSHITIIGELGEQKDNFKNLQNTILAIIKRIYTLTQNFEKITDTLDLDKFKKIKTYFTRLISQLSFFLKKRIEPIMSKETYGDFINKITNVINAFINCVNEFEYTNEFTTNETSLQNLENAYTNFMGNFTDIKITDNNAITDEKLNIFDDVHPGMDLPFASDITNIKSSLDSKEEIKKITLFDIDDNTIKKIKHPRAKKANKNSSEIKQQAKQNENTINLDENKEENLNEDKKNTFKDTVPKKELLFTSDIKNLNPEKIKLFKIYKDKAKKIKQKQPEDVTNNNNNKSSDEEYLHNKNKRKKIDNN